MQCGVKWCESEKTRFVVKVKSGIEINHKK
jgi:hypothetical protein